MKGRALFGVLAIAAAAACGGGGGSSGDSTSPDVFVAFATDMNDYKTWHQYPVDPTIFVEAGIHAAGKRIEYLNKLPPHGSKTFPIGTIIVKEIHADVPSDSRTFAMVKRGGGFNSAGASGWEWFELQLDAQPVVITWRGIGPPAGEKYGGDGNGACNSCHGSTADNDYVLSHGLQLGNF